MMLSTVSSNRPSDAPADPFFATSARPALLWACCAGWGSAWGADPAINKRAAAKPTLFARIDV